MSPEKRCNTVDLPFSADDIGVIVMKTIVVQAGGFTFRRRGVPDS